MHEAFAPAILICLSKRPCNACCLMSLRWAKDARAMLIPSWVR